MGTHKDDAESVCAVCLEECKQDGIVVKCGHKFHENCLLEWILQDPEQCIELNKYLGSTAALRGTCPMCRQELAHVFNVNPVKQDACCVIS